ncbi:phage tail protein [Acinetobacter johnsonii]|uniref:phage tail protein n=1 Tax=Acinetobacter johnsonii TaxID=40214 RepID=UPI0032B38CBE
MSDYFNVTTNVGDAAIANAIANNSKLNITHIAFGDGNGSVPTPTKTRTSLVKEVHRQAVTKYTMHPTIANYIVIETIIPSNIGGFWIREMGIIADNVLISHGSHAPFFKVADPDGVSEYRLKFTQNVRDGNVVEISLDESLIYASQAWVNENYIRRNELVDNLTTDDAKKVLTAKQGKLLSEVKVNKTESFKDAFSSDLDYYVDKAQTSDYGFTSCADFPIGTRILVASNLNFADFPVLDSNFVYIETKKTFDNPGRQQVAYGYNTGLIAIRVAGTGSTSYGLWKYFAFQDSNITGNAATASKWQNQRTVNFSGAATGSFTSDGSNDSSVILTLANSGVIAGTYGSPLKIPVITVNQKGLLTVVAEQNIPVGLEKNQLMKAGSSKITSSATLEQFLNNYYGLSVPFFENGAAGLFGQYSSGLVSSYEGGGTFAIGASVIDGRVYGVAAPQNILAEAMRFEFYTTRSVQFNGNAVSASKLQNPRTIFGQNFDGSGDVGGTVTASTGLVQSDEYHYIDMGRNGLNRMSFYNYGATFNFIDSENGNVVARITQNGIDCNAASASKLKTPRKINGVNFDGSTDINLPLIGVNQTWQNLTASRAAETIYTNTTGKPIQVAINYNGNSAYFDIGGVEIYMPDWDAFGFAFFIIPNGTTYRIRNQVGINSWSELR